MADSDPIVAYWKRHWPADRDERVRRERNNLRLFLNLVKSEPARLRQARVLVVNAGPRAMLEHLKAKTRIAIDPHNGHYIAEGLLRPKEGDGETMYLSGDLRDVSLPAGYFDFVFLNFRVADAAEACAFLTAASRVAALWGRIGVNLTISQSVGARDEGLLRSAVRDYGDSLQLERVNGLQRLRGLIRADTPADAPKVSVFLNSYNHRSFIAEALDSVLMQETDFAYEIIAWDDGSSDGTREIILQYAAKYPEKFRLCLSERNLGLVDGAAWTRVWLDKLRRADGSYIALIEGDDCWTARVKLQRQVDFLDEHLDFVLCGHEHNIRTESTGFEITKRRRFREDTTLSIAQLLERNQFHTSSLMFRNGILRDWPREFLGLQFTDWPLQIFLAQRGDVRMFAEPMSTYRVHSGGFWTARYTDKEDLGISREGWEVIIHYWKLVNKHLGYRYDKLIRTLIARGREEIAARPACP